MARYSFAGTSADIILKQGVGGLLRVDESETLTFWDAASGGSQVKVSYADSPGTEQQQITVSQYVPTLLGPDGVTEMWVEVEDGRRFHLTAHVPPGSLADAAIPKNTLTSAGDLVTYNGATSLVDRLPVGSDGRVPVADSGAPLGITWGDIDGGTL